MSATVCFCHGRESGPWGTKIRRLARVAEQHSCRVVSLDDRDTQDPAMRVQKLLDAAASFHRPLILVGSSMGGYVAAVASSRLQPLGLFLLAPAVGVPGYAVQEPELVSSHVAIVHGWDDLVVPVESVLHLARSQRATLHLLPDGHLLKEKLEHIARIFDEFLALCLGSPRFDLPAREMVAAL
jgi:alpha/beta superfamily hydrolase